MTTRFFAYLLGTFAGALLVVHGQEPRWYLAQLIRAAVLLGLAIAALVWPERVWIVPVAGGLALVWFFLPRACWEAAYRLRVQERWPAAARWQRLAGWLSGGRRGWLFRQYARVFDWLAFGNPSQAESVLDDLADRHLPGPVRSEVRLWKLSLLTQRRRWHEALALYERQPHWSTLRLAVRARLHAARAYAETGQLIRGLAGLQSIARSPGLALFEKEYWAVRVRLAAMAGDAAELERLLDRPGHARRGFPRFAAYWRGRCALVRGDRTVALPLLTRAYALTHPLDDAWRQAIRYHVERAQHSEPLPAPASASGEYVLAITQIRDAETECAPWGALLNTTKPTVVTSLLIGGLVLAWIAAELLWRLRRLDLSVWASNNAPAVRAGEWWRLVTAMFIHADWLHLCANALGLWFFGTAMEKLSGRARVLVIFLLGGLLGNLLSALLNPHQVSIGASAGVFALVGAYGLSAWRLPLPRFKSRLLQMLGLVVAIDLLIGAFDPAIDDWAHVGGLVSGLLLAVVLGRPQQKLGNQSTPGL